jgi:hypothetical protein
MLVYCLDYYLTLKLEVIRSSETSVDFHRTAQSNISTALKSFKSDLCMSASSGADTSVEEIAGP